MIARVTQLGIAIAVLGGVITVIGLFPSVTGTEAAAGVGILQILVMLIGFSMLILGAYIFVQATYYPGIKHNLAQQIAVRLSMTGLIIAAASGLADVLGFGSHPSSPDQRPLLGTYQTIGLIGGFVIASLGVVLFVLKGDPSGPRSNGDSSE